MSDGGKGSMPRPFSVSQEKFSDNWDKIFKPKKEVEKFLKKFSDDYQDILSTEDCVLDAFVDTQKTKK